MGREAKGVASSGAEDVKHKLKEIAIHLRMTKACFGTEFYSVPTASHSKVKVSASTVRRVPSLKFRNEIFHKREYKIYRESELELAEKELSILYHANSRPAKISLPEEKEPSFINRYSILNARKPALLSPSYPSVPYRTKELMCQTVFLHEQFQQSNPSLVSMTSELAHQQRYLFNRQCNRAFISHLRDVCHSTKLSRA